MYNIRRGYQGLFLDAASRQKLEKMQGRPLTNMVSDMHVTFAYGSIIPYAEETAGKAWEIPVTGYACDGKNSAFLVELPEELMKIYANTDVPPHVTVSTAEGAKPKDSGKLAFTRLDEPFMVRGTLQNRLWKEGRRK